MKEVESFFDDIPLPEVQPAVQARIEAALRQSLRPVSPLSSLAARTSQFFGVFVAIGLLKLVAFGTASFTQMNIAELVGQLVVTIAAALLLSLSLAREMTPGRLRRLPQQAVVALGLTVFVLGALLFFPNGATQSFVAEGWPCLRAGLLMTLPATALLFWLLRRGAPLGGPALGQSLGAAAGLLAAIVPNVSLSTCSHEAIVGHLVVFHGGVVLLAGVAGACIAAAWRLRAA